MSYSLAGEDDKSYSVRHSDGRVFPVAKRGLSEEMHGRIRSMPKAMADGGEVAPPGPYDESGVIREELRTPGGSAPVGLGAVGEAIHEAYSSPTALALERQQAAAGPTAQVDPRLAAAQRTVEGLQNLAQQGGDMQAQQAQMVTPIRNPLGYLGGVESKLNEAQRLQATGIRGQAEAEQSGLAQQATAAEANAAAQQQILQQYQDHTKQLWSEHQRIQRDVENQHIDPQRIWSNKGTAQKVSTIIGLVLGGGAGNPALAILQREIDRDVDAQKAELGKRENLLSDNLRQFGTLDAATAATRMQLQAIAEGQAKAIAARSGSKAAMAKADAMVGQTMQAAVPEYMKLGEIRAQYAYQSAMMGMIQGGGGGQQERIHPQSLPPSMPKEMSLKGMAEAQQENRDRSIPGPAGTTVRAWDAKSAQDARARLTGADSARNTLAEMQRLSTTALPGTQGAATYAGLEETLAAEIARLMHGTVTAESLQSARKSVPGGLANAVRSRAFEPVLKTIENAERSIWKTYANLPFPEHRAPPKAR